MKTAVQRRTVDLSAYPDLVVILLGMRVRTLTGLRTLFGIGPQVMRAAAERPDGLLHVENNIVASLFPMHVTMRWYWRDFESMERWSRSEQHRRWWIDFLRDSKGTGFWHETYFMGGGMEAVYDDMTGKPVGFAAFAPTMPARGAMFSARARLRKGEAAPRQPEGMGERELYD